MKTEKILRSEFLHGAKDGIPIALGFLSLSFTFGITACRMGIPGWITFLISVTNLTVSGQLAGIGMMVSGASIPEFILTISVINLRFALVSVALSQIVDKSVRIRDRLLLSTTTTAEVFAVAQDQKRLLGRQYLYGIYTVPFAGWMLGTVLGIAAAGLLPQTVLSALGMALYAALIALIVPPAKKERPILLVLSVSVLLSCAFRYVPLFSHITSGLAIVICGVVGAILGALVSPVEK